MIRALSYIRSKNLVPVLVLYFSVGLVGMILPFTRSIFQNLTPFSLLMSFILLLLFHDRFDPRFWTISAFIFFAGIGIEALGVATGKIFGEYTYGGTLGPEIFHTPLMIGLNWLMLVYCTLSIVSRFVETRYFRAIGAATLMVVYDFALEPAAIHLEMWSWSGGAVPLQNYLAWFFIAFIFSFLADHFRLTSRENKLAMPLFFIQLCFFIILDLWIFAAKLWDF